jgi:O-antigen ligase
MKFIRVGICCLLAFSVLSFGAVEEWSQAVLEVGASLLLCFWAIRQYILRTDLLFVPPEIPPLAAFALVAVLQSVFHVTASRYDTRIELQLLLTYVIVLFLMSQAYLRTSQWRGFFWFLMILGFCVSLFAVLQYLTFNGRLYWVRELRYGGTPFGPYVNRNHFAGFAEMVIPISLVPLALGKVRRERLLLVALLAVVPIVALFLSASRGGIVSFAVEIVLLFLLLLIRKVHGKFVIAGGIVVLVAILTVSWIGIKQVLERFSEIHSIEVSPGKRAAIRHDTWRIFLDHPVWGTGLGTFQMVFPAYDSAYDGKVVNNAHNDYLEALAETGLLGGICCAWFLASLALNSLRGLAEPVTSFRSVLNLSGLIACTGILVHSLVDFNLHIPANALIFFVSAHMSVVRPQPTDSLVAGT